MESFPLLHHRCNACLQTVPFRAHTAATISLALANQFPHCHGKVLLSTNQTVGSLAPAAYKRHGICSEQHQIQFILPSSNSPTVASKTSCRHGKSDGSHNSPIVHHYVASTSGQHCTLAQALVHSMHAQTLVPL